MSKSLDYLLENKKEELKADWIKNVFVRYKIYNTRNSLSEAILRTFNKGEYKKSYPELENFYNKIIENLEEESNLNEKEIYTKIFQDEKLKRYMQRNDIVLIKNEDFRKLGFYFKNNEKFKFYFFPKVIRNLKANCNLLKYLASIDIKLPYNYFKIRMKEKKKYIDIVNNIQEIKIQKTKELCYPTIEIINDKKLSNKYLSFIDNLFSDKKKEDFKFYLFLFPKILNLNFIIFTPFENNIVVQNIIEENEEFPYLILFNPLETFNFYFKIELGGMIIDRRIKSLLNNKQDKEIIKKIKERYSNKFLNQKPIIDFLKFQKENKETKYLKDYDLETENQELNNLLENLKYYNYQL